MCEKAITPYGRTCFSCFDINGIDGVLVTTSYKVKIINKAIHNLKYRFVNDFSIPLGKIMKNSFLSSDLPLPDIIIPVPLHSRRLRWRGFNQSELLANELAENISPGFKIPVRTDLIYRCRNTNSQMKIKNYQERKDNLKNAFVVSTVTNMKNKKILLVDDVATTGSTLFECTKSLKESGAKEIFGIVIARQETS